MTSEAQNSGAQRPDPSVAGLGSFAAAERLLAEAAGPERRPGYVLLGSDGFLQQWCRRGLIRELVPEGMREFSLHELDLGEISVFEALDLAQTPSLMAPFQLLLLRNVKTLYGRGAKKEEFAALEAYFRSPNPAALLVFVADHIPLPEDLRRMDMTDKERVERLRETLGEWCGVVELKAVSGGDAAVWARRQAGAQGVTLDEDAARELVDALGGDTLMLASELEKLLLYAGALGQTSLGLADVEAMVSSAKQRSLYELTDAISRREPGRALMLLGGLLNAGEGGEDAAIGHVFSLAKTYRQMLVLAEKGVRDQRGMWAVLWPGFRVPPFAAEALLAQARRFTDRGELRRGLQRIARADLELRSGPPDKRLVLERLVLALSRPAAAGHAEA